MKGGDLMFFNSVRILYTVGSSVAAGLATTTLAISPVTIAIVASAAVAGTAAYALNPSKNN